MDDWKRHYTTFLFYAVGVVGAALMALQSITSNGVEVPPWALPILAGVGIFLKTLPQEPKA